jgi:hypothetical protein
MVHPEAYDSAFWKSLPNGTFWPGAGRARAFTCVLCPR